MKSLLNSYYLITRKKIPTYLKYYLAKKSKEGDLPKEYQQVGYIESTGTQYIDTGINPISSTRIDINFAYVVTNYGGWVPIFGARSIVNNVQEQYGVFIDDRNLKLTTNYSSRDVGGNSNVYIEANKKYNLKNNQGLFYINDILESSISVSDTLSNNTIYPVYLFDLCNYGTRLNRGTKMKLYSCKFYDGDTLIRNFIPCYRKSDNEIGLYDTVNNVFYTNQGTGKFIAGGYLPSEYQQVGYIESTGTQYINTQISSNINIESEIDVQFTQDSTSAQILIWISSSSGQWAGQVNKKYGLGGGIGFNIISTIRKLVKISFSANNSTQTVNMEIDGNVISRNGTVPPATNYKIFKTDTYGSYARIYSVIIKENDVILRKYIPCYRKSDNEIGLYDIVNNVFYTNQGTGEFIAGGDV